MSFLERALNIIMTGEAPLKTGTPEQVALADQKRAQAAHALAHPAPAAPVVATQARHAPANHAESTSESHAHPAPTEHAPENHASAVPAPVQTAQVQHAPANPATAVANPETARNVNAIKGYGYFEKRINEIRGFSKYLEGLVLAIMILQYFPKGVKNHPILETMGIERDEIVEILRRLFGEFNEEYKDAENISLIGNMNGKGNIKRFLFDDILQFSEQTGNRAIDTILPRFFNRLTQFDLAKNPFFQMKNLKKYIEIVISIGSGKTIFEDPQRGISKGELLQGEKTEIDFVRNALNLPNRNAPKMNFLVGLDDHNEPEPKKGETGPEKAIGNDEILEAAHESVAEDDEIQELLSLADILSNMGKDEPMRKELSKVNSPFFDHFLENIGILPGNVMEHLMEILKKQGKTLNSRNVSLHLKKMAHESIVSYQSIIKKMETEKK